MEYVEHPSYDGLLGPDDDRLEEFEKDYNKHGFDDSVTWSLDASLIKWLTPRLKRFLEVSKEIVDDDEFHSDVEKALDGFELYLSKDYNEFNKEHNAKVTNSFKILSEIWGGLWW